jgi:hypothetical protein
MANANTERAALWRQLKELGWASDRPFVKYTLDELRAEVELFTEVGPKEYVPDYGHPMAMAEALLLQEAAASTKLDGETHVVQNWDEPNELPAFELPGPEQPSSPAPTAPAPAPAAPIVAAPDPNELPGQRLNTQGGAPIRIDEAGREWYQEEVKKPSYPKPRGRRVLRYQETGVEQVTVQDGAYTETFEVAGSGPGQAAEVKITLPSYQVGIYKDPRFPFKIHTYNGIEGFDLFEVEEFYGGSELVPATVKRMYVENHLCYNIRSVIRTIEAEHRQLQLTGRIQA